MTCYTKSVIVKIAAVNNAAAIAMGVVRAVADAVYIGTSALIAIGCKMCMMCTTGMCAWEIATQNGQLVKRLKPEIASEQLVNMLNGWEIEMKDILGGRV